MNGQSEDWMNCCDKSQADNTFALQAEQIPTLPGNLMQLPEVWEGFGRFSILLVLDEGQGALASQESVTFLLYVL